MGKIKCEICKKKFFEKGFGLHLKRTHGLTRKEYYDIYLKIKNENICKMPDCNNKTCWDNTKHTYKNFCNKCCKKRNLNYFIITYGKKEGTKKYKERCKNSSFNYEKCIEIYGEDEGNIFWKKHLKNISSKLENFIEKYGEKEGTKKYNDKSKKCSHSLDNYIKWHGEKEGTKKYKEKCKKCSHSLDNYIKWYGEEEGPKKYKEKCKKCSHSLDNYIKWYGEEEGPKKYNKWVKSCSHDLNFFIGKYGEEEGTKKYKSWVKKATTFKTNLASKESMEIFFPLIDWLLKNEICIFDDVYVGIKGSKEYYLNCKNTTNNFYLYDFTIRNLNIIIEYNGEYFHPNPKWLNEDIDKWNDWRQLFSNKSSNEIYKENQNKINSAKEKGFNVLEIWSSDSIKYNLNKCKQFIKRVI